MTTCAEAHAPRSLESAIYESGACHEQNRHLGCQILNGGVYMDMGSE